MFSHLQKAGFLTTRLNLCESIKANVLGSHQNNTAEGTLMTQVTNNISFGGEIRGNPLIIITNSPNIIWFIG